MSIRRDGMMRPMSGRCASTSSQLYYLTVPWIRARSIYPQLAQGTSATPLAHCRCNSGPIGPLLSTATAALAAGGFETGYAATSMRRQL